MADNTQINIGTSGDVIRDKERSGVKTQIVAFDLNPAGSEQLMAGVMPVNDNGGSLTVDGPVTDTELRATPLPVDGPLTDTELRATPVPVSGPLTDTELRATPLPVSGPLTDTELRATAVPVSAASLPLPAGAASESTLANVLTTSDFDTKAGALTETAPATDTASSGLNGRLQRIAQRLTSLITALGSPFQAGGAIANTVFGATQNGTWTVQPGNTANTTAWKVTDERPSTGTTSSVANSVTSVTLLSSNTSRRGATFFNDDTAATVYLKLGATASTSSFAVKILPGGYYELPQPNYTGVIDAIASAATGSMRITELT